MRAAGSIADHGSSLTREPVRCMLIRVQVPDDADCKLHPRVKWEVGASAPRFIPTLPPQR